MRRQARFLSTVGAAVVCLTTLADAQRAYAEGPAAVQGDDLKILVKDIKMFEVRCHHDITKDDPHYASCTNEKAGLIERQNKLGATDETINKAMNSGTSARSLGWRWP